ncbi:unnamed protein product, partial [Meganyctiphanes norvegica]
LDKMINSLSMESDEDKWPQVCVKPTTTVYGYIKCFQEKTVQENEEISKPVVLKSYRYWKKIRKKKSPRTLMGQRNEKCVMLSKENGTRSYKENSSVLKKNYKFVKKKHKSESDQKFTLRTAVLIVLIKILLRTNFPFMKGKHMESATTKDITYKDGKFKFKYKDNFSIFVLYVFQNGNFYQ